MTGLYDRMAADPTRLDDAEIIALALGENPAAANAILTAAGELRKITDTPLGPHLRARIRACLELARRISQQQPRLLTDAGDAIALLSDMATLKQEQLRVVLVDANVQVRGVETVYIGTKTTIRMDLGEILRMPLLYNTTAFIIAHNHPQATCAPSASDLEWTRKLHLLAQLQGIHLLDHLIFGTDGCASLALTHPELFADDDPDQPELS